MTHGRDHLIVFGRKLNSLSGEAGSSISSAPTALTGQARLPLGLDSVLVLVLIVVILNSL